MNYTQKKKVFNYRLISIIMIFFLCISCGYQYIKYQIQFEKYKADQIELHEQYQEIRWETIYSILGVLNREGKLHSKLVAYSLRQDIEKLYPDLSVLQQSLDHGEYNNDEKFSSVIVNTVASNGIFNEASSRNGVLISCDDKVLYNLIINTDKFDIPLKDFIANNYNVQLAQNSFNAIFRYSDELKLIEPYEPVKGSDGHRIINRASIDQLKQVYLREGLDGLSAYLLINPFYITKTGDLFNVPDFGKNGLRNSNHKIIVMSYISIYDVIKMHHKDRLDALTKLENESLSKMNKNLIDAYYSSIESLLLHFFFIVVILLLTKTVKENEE